MRVSALRLAGPMGPAYYWPDLSRPREGERVSLLLSPDAAMGYFARDKEGTMRLFVPPGSRDREGNLLAPHALGLTAADALRLGFARVPFDLEEDHA
jgi:hypothetical protein